jgi:hypothetical protein
MFLEKEEDFSSIKNSINNLTQVLKSIISENKRKLSVRKRTAENLV